MVRAIIAEVAARGDQALAEYTRQFDRVDLRETGLKVTGAEIELATATCDRRALDALAFARDRIEAYHRRQLPKASASPTRSGSSSARAGPRSRRSASMSRAAPPPIRRRC